MLVYCLKKYLPPFRRFMLYTFLIQGSGLGQTDNRKLAIIYILTKDEKQLKKN